MNIYNQIKKVISVIIQKLFTLHKTNETERRQENILNILLAFSIFCFMVINIIRIIDFTIFKMRAGIPLYITLLILLFFIFLFWLSRQGYLKLASFLLVFTFSLPMFYSFITWGADLPAALLLAVLIITLSGILLGAPFAFFSTFLISAGLIILTGLETHGLIIVKNYWRESQTEICDAIVYDSMLIVIAAVAWLFCREVKKALQRAQKSEVLLREERDLLEVKVENRTKELRELETEKINQLYRLAEFGRLSAGIFHDLVNPLTAVSLSLEQMSMETDNQISHAKLYLDQALSATDKMGKLVKSIKQQISRECDIYQFSLNEEIEQIIQILGYKARKAQALIKYNPNSNIKITADPIKFSQIITNLLANAIEACETRTKREIEITLWENIESIVITVSDTGSGIPAENIDKIFEPFFSTKRSSGRGLGIGLSSTRDIIKKNFQGEIMVQSEINQGTKFTINIPKKND